MEILVIALTQLCMCCCYKLCARFMGWLSPEFYYQFFSSPMTTNEKWYNRSKYLQILFGSESKVFTSSESNLSTTALLSFFWSISGKIPYFSARESLNKISLTAHSLDSSMCLVLCINVTDSEPLQDRHRLWLPCVAPLVALLWSMAVVFSCHHFPDCDEMTTTLLDSSTYAASISIFCCFNTTECVQNCMQVNIILHFESLRNFSYWSLMQTGLWLFLCDLL